MKRVCSNAVGLSASLCLLLASGCHQGMWNGSRIKPLEMVPAVASLASFTGGMTALPVVEGTVPFESAQLDSFLYTGKINGDYATSFPFEITRSVLERGRERYTIFCAPCHGQTGDGRGMIVQREMKQAGNYHDPRLVASPPGYFFDVMTNGFGVMYSYASRVSPEDRWAIAAYIRVLQLSQNATIGDVPPAELEKLSQPNPSRGEQGTTAEHATH